MVCTITQSTFWRPLNSLSTAVLRLDTFDIAMGGSEATPRAAAIYGNQASMDQIFVSFLDSTGYLNNQWQKDNKIADPDHSGDPATNMGIAISRIDNPNILCIWSNRSSTNSNGVVINNQRYYHGSINGAVLSQLYRDNIKTDFPQVPTRFYISHTKPVSINNTGQGAAALIGANNNNNTNQFWGCYYNGMGSWNNMNLYTGDKFLNNGKVVTPFPQGVTTGTNFKSPESDFFVLGTVFKNNPFNNSGFGNLVYAYITQGTTNFTTQIVDLNGGVNPAPPSFGIDTNSGQLGLISVGFNNATTIGSFRTLNELLISNFDTVSASPSTPIAIGPMTGNGIQLIVTNTKIMSRFYRYDGNNSSFDVLTPVFTLNDISDNNTLMLRSVSVTMDNNDNGIAIWQDRKNNVWASVYLSHCNQWLQPELVKSATRTPQVPEATGFFVKTDMIPTSQGVIAWNAIASDESALFSSQLNNVLPSGQSLIVNSNITTGYNTVQNLNVADLSGAIPISVTKIRNSLSGATVIEALNRFPLQGEYFNQISWQSVSNAKGYNVYRNVDCFVYDQSTPIATTTNTVYQDHNRKPNSKDTYCVTVVNDSNLDCCNQLEWVQIPGATGYNILRNGVKINTVPLSPTTTTYIDCAIVAGVEYTYSLEIITNSGTCKIVAWDPDTDPLTCNYNVYRSDDGTMPSCLLTSQSFLVPSGTYAGKQAIVDCGATVDQKYVVTICRKASESDSCDDCCDKYNIIAWDANTITDKAGGFNIYVDGELRETVDAMITTYNDFIATSLSHKYIITAIDSNGVEWFPGANNCAISVSACQNPVAACS